MSRELQICLRCRAIISKRDKVCPQCHMACEPIVDHDYFLNSRLPSDEGLYLLDGTVIDERYQIESLIGKGCHGKVYLASDLLQASQVVLKINMVDPNNDDLKKFSNEHHPHQRIQDTSHVIQIFDLQILKWEGATLMVVSMEYANGGTFRTWLNSHQNNPKLRATTGLEVFRKICKGFAALHQADIIHGNVKPENLMFVDNCIKVTDYLQMGCRIEKVRGTENTDNYSGSPRGAPIYMSPEQFIASGPEKIDMRSDIYSLGVILFELVDPHGRPPFYGSSSQLQELHLEALPSIEPGVDENLKTAINHCLAKNPDLRYHSVDELLSDLNETPQGKSASGQDPKTDNTSSPEGLWASACHFFGQGYFKKATGIVEEILKIAPNHHPAKGLKTELQLRFAQAQRVYGEIALNLENNLDAAASLLKEAASLYPNHPAGYDIQSKLAYRLSYYRHAMEEGCLALKKHRWDTALAWFRSALETHPGDHNLASLTEQLAKVEALRKGINSALRKGDLNRARYLARLVDIETEELQIALPLRKGLDWRNEIS